jgi:hypothetical protein
MVTGDFVKDIAGSGRNIGGFWVVGRPPNCSAEDFRVVKRVERPMATSFTRDRLETAE